MSRKFGFLWVFGILILGLASNASVSVASEAWEGTGYVWEVKTSNGMAFSFYLSNGTQYFELLNNNTPATTIYIYKDGSNYYADNLIDGLGNAFNIGTSDKFYFSFANNALSDYTLGTSIPKYLYTVTSLDTTKQVTIASADIRPVPVPGSALLLGSSLLGLVGISTRKKKA